MRLSRDAVTLHMQGAAESPQEDVTPPSEENRVPSARELIE